MNRQEYAYWMAFADMPKMWTSRKNELIVKFLANNDTIVDFFHSDDWSGCYGTTDEENGWLGMALQELPNYAFLAEDLLNQGYDLVPSCDARFSVRLKKNLKYNTPVLFYLKGNCDLLNKSAAAIVGSRNADQISLKFTDSMAKNLVSKGKVVVSGFAKGIDRQALDACLEANGQSVVVLPQGIMTFGSGFKQYYQQIVGGDVLVVSAFHPKAPWNVGLAMARNPIIYGLSDEIYVAQSDAKGGTWEGVIDGLKRGRNIYVRTPEKNEKNANAILIQKGAIPIGMDGVSIPNVTNLPPKELELELF